MQKILIVDDDKLTCDFITELLDEFKVAILSAQTPQDALDVGSADRPDVVISDINLQSRLTGLDLLKRFKQSLPESEVILISGFGTLETAIEAVREGAFDYISKPFNINEVKAVVKRALEKKRLLKENEQLKIRLESIQPSTSLIGSSPKMLAVYKSIASVVGSKSTVLIYGESGTGKELVAKQIHANSPRKPRSFLAVNCGAVTESLLETELFGCQKGAFTGASADRIGLFEEADGGTLFLDEVGDMTPAMQVKLLRALQEGEIKRVGGVKTIRVDVRLIAATHYDLEDLTREGRFREDLLYRLSVITIALPPLRERREDIAPLISHFVRKHSQNHRPLPSISQEAMDALTNYSWPGNVRELENTIERLCQFSKGGIVTLDDLPSKMDSKVRFHHSHLFDGLPSLDELELRYLLHILDVTKHHRSQTAEILGINRRTLYRMAERFGIDLKED
ncbi:MAG: sigma-54-dependent Fis family transcriptional regulator [Acidimicrobiia bacterium]|nr:sigma-54-dependent Fis family transcriptional regulator [Acidimicrobiia bacterium]